VKPCPSQTFQLYIPCAAELIERIKRKAPAYLDLLTAETVHEFEAAFCVILEGAVQHFGEE
jgi:hypothetical protein